MTKKYTENNILSAVRITQDAKDKLTVIAGRKRTTLGSTASRIILHYATNNLDYDIATGDIIKSIHNHLLAQSVVLSKIAGNTNRTESFIKSLLREDNGRSENMSSLQHGEDEAEIPGPVNAEYLSRSLELLSLFLSSAKPGKGFMGEEVIQVRFSPAEFNKIKIAYEELCSLLSL